MKRVITILFAVIAISSCQMAKFKGTQGEKLTSVPEELTGTYDFKSGIFSNSQKDSIFVCVDKTKVTFAERSGVVEKKINTDFKFSKLGDFYVLAIPDETVKNFYNYIVIEKTGNNLRLYPVYDEKDETDPSVFKKYFDSKPLNYKHEPGSNEDKNDEAPAPARSRYYVATTDKFTDFFEKELKGKKYLQLNRYKGSKNKSVKK